MILLRGGNRRLELLLVKRNPTARFMGGAWVFPTIKHLEQLEGFISADAALEHAHRHEVVPIEPRVLVSGETARVVLPGEPGYEQG